MELIARTGTTTPSGNPITALGTGPSINDAGKVAYAVTVQDGRQGIFVSGETAARSTLIDSFPVGFWTFAELARNFHFPDVLQINNQDRVAWRVWSRDGLFSFIFRLGPSVADYKVVAKTRYDRIDTPDEDLPSPFCGAFPLPTTGLTPSVSLNNSGRTVFSGILCGTANQFVLSTPRDPTAGGHNFDTDFYASPALLNVSNFFPQIADTEAVVVRGGRPSTSPIMLFVDPTLDPGTATFIATSSTYDALGERPGISDDGRVVAFMGAHKTQGVGVYCAVIGPDKAVAAGPFKVTGFPGFSAFIERARTGVNRSDSDALAGSQYEIVYLAFGESGTPGQAGPLGLYATAIDITDIARPSISAPRLLARAGNSLPPLSSPVQSIGIYDPVNNHGQVAFWVTTGAEQAIVRATPCTGDVDLTGRIARSDREDAILPGATTAVAITLRNVGCKPASGSVRIRIFLSADRTLSEQTDFLLEDIVSVPFDMPGSGQLEITRTVTFPPANTLGKDRAGIWYFILQIDPEQRFQADNNRANNVVPSESIWIGQLINVLTHGFGNGLFPPDFLTPWYSLRAKYETLAEGTPLQGAVDSSVANWRSSEGWVDAAGQFLLGLFLLVTLDPAGASEAFQAAQMQMERAKVLAEAAAAQIVSDLDSRFGLQRELTTQGYQIVHLIGHSRGGAVNARVANLLTQHGHRVNQYTALDGYSVDWPFPSGMLGDIDITAEVAAAHRRQPLARLVNYRVEDGLEQHAFDFLFPYLEAAFVARFGPGYRHFSEPVRLLIHNALPGWKAPERPGLETLFVLGAGVGDLARSHHLNVVQLYSQSDARDRPNQYIFDNYFGFALDVSRHAGNFRAQFAPALQPQASGPPATADSPIGAQFIDGTFESIGSHRERLAALPRPDVDDDAIKILAAELHDTGKLFTSLWSTTGAVHLVKRDASFVAELVGSSGSSLGQLLILRPGAESVTFDARVVVRGANDVLSLTFGTDLLRTLVLGEAGILQHVSVPLANHKGAGEFRVQLRGDSPTTVVQVDNFQVRYSGPRISQILSSPDGHVRIAVDGLPNVRYSLEAAEDLISWFELTILEGVSARKEFTDRLEGAHRFYRAQTLR